MDREGFVKEIEIHFHLTGFINHLQTCVKPELNNFRIDKNTPPFLLAGYSQIKQTDTETYPKEIASEGHVSAAS